MDGDYVRLVFVGRELSNNFNCLIIFWSWFSLFLCVDGAIYHTFGNHTCSKKKKQELVIIVSFSSHVCVSDAECIKHCRLMVRTLVRPPG